MLTLALFCCVVQCPIIPFHVCNAQDLSRHLPTSKLRYVFDNLAYATALYVTWLLQDLTEINHFGVERIRRLLSVL